MQNTSPTKSERAAEKAAALVEWFKQRSMLLKHDSMISAFTGSSSQWKHGFGHPRKEDLLDETSVWFAAYPDSLIGTAGENALAIIGSTELLQLFAKLGVEAIHTGPMKRAGSVCESEYGASIDGHFDRIECEIDPDYGTEAQYVEMVENASRYAITIIGDLIPGHTGKGPDFRLATRNVPGFPGLYTIVEIAADDWPILPPVPAGQDSVNLSQSAVKRLKQKGYDPIGPFDTEVFARPGIKESSWSATDIIPGVDGRNRRWVYLHIFKQGQPSLNWSDPSFAAHRLVTADLLHSLTQLGVKGLRLDATMFLGIETGATGKDSWLDGHPLSNRVTDQIGLTIRKFGGFSFQELNADLQQVKDSLESGPEFNYDFFTRPGYLYALVTGDAGPLRLLLREMLDHGIQPMRLVHGLQNHDELMLEATHLRVNGDKEFEYEGNRERGDRLFRRIHEEVIRATTEQAAPYNREFAMSPGVCSTLCGFIAAALGFENIDNLSSDQKNQIANAHLLAAAFNALQGGVFLLSGWDLVGALPVPEEMVDDLIADNDHRWINRGGYDLLGTAEAVDRSVQGLPRAESLYGSVAVQLLDEGSFASRLQSMLGARNAARICRAELLTIPTVDHEGLVVMVNKLPESATAWQVTALNFGRSRVCQTVHQSRLSGRAKAIWSSLQGTVADEIECLNESITVELEPLEARLIVVRP